MSTLGERQEALIRALVAGGELPEGFDKDEAAVVSAALLRKRAGEVAHHLPVVRHTLGRSLSSVVHSVGGQTAEVVFACECPGLCRPSPGHRRTASPTLVSEVSKGLTQVRQQLRWCT